MRRDTLNLSSCFHRKLVKKQLRPFELGPDFASRVAHFSAPPIYILCLGVSILELSTCGFNNPIGGSSARGLHAHKVRVIASDGAAYRKILHVELRNPLCGICEAFDVVAAIKILRELGLGGIIASDDVKYGFPRFLRRPPLCKFRRVAQPIRVSLKLDRCCFHCELADGAREHLQWCRANPSD